MLLGLGLLAGIESAHGMSAQEIGRAHGPPAGQLQFENIEKAPSTASYAQPIGDGTRGRVAVHCGHTMDLRRD